jgi:hypothetical protein
MVKRILIKGMLYGILFWVWTNLFAQVYLGIQESLGVAIQ